jgi:hypothetical protein
MGEIRGGRSECFSWGLLRTALSLSFGCWIISQMGKNGMGELGMLAL